MSRINKSDMQPSNPEVLKEYEVFKTNVTANAMSILRDRIPEKILYFNSLVSITSAPREILHISDLLPWEPFPADAPAINPASQSTKKVTCIPNIEDDTADTVGGADGAQSPPGKKQKAGVDGSKHVSTKRACPTGAKANHTASIEPTWRASYCQKMLSQPQVAEVANLIKAEASELIEMVGVVKLWIQLNVPRIEDGNNFGVAIQEEAIQELARVEDSAFNLYESIFKYFTTRAKLVSKVMKYPNLQDYREAIRELDEKEWMHLKITKVDMRNNYSMLYDLLNKNWEKVVKPRNNDGSAMLY